MRRLLILTLLVASACRIERAESGRPAGVASDADSLALVEQDSAINAEVSAALRNYYARLSSRDWLAYRRSFWPGAIITTRWTPPGERRERVWVQTIEDYVRRAPDGPGRMAVFNQRMLAIRTMGYGDLASAWVTYEARWGRRLDSLETHRGVDAFHLYREGGDWRITGLTFTGEIPGRPLLPPWLQRRPEPAAAGAGGVATP